MFSNDIYQYTIQKMDGEEISLSAFKNKVLLIVNTASQCGFTPQLKDLAELKETYAGQDFEILAFPSNDFGGQEPLEGEALESFCRNNVKNYPVFNKVRVRGPYAHPLFKFLSDKKLNGVFNAVPKWNFHKFLVDRSGKVIDYFYPFTKPTSSKVRKKITRLLSNPIK
ncbi:glutathione peroxidase [Mucilaginibacter hurinus]|uniref:Glutathione peroxidase n=1 Tax=Mucilaginibacter hurinus TaxID=2201324 RepID=A0A367GST2_9SPHI|nr:glutathione peroxidase [Mucilaginibacter hurinus]RCH56489.1 glutathione peroxidase [Mucilaginibacter hurinus]